MELNAVARRSVPHDCGVVRSFPSGWPLLPAVLWLEEKAMPVYQYECTPCQVETTRLLRSARNVGAQ